MRGWAIRMPEEEAATIRILQGGCVGSDPLKALSYGSSNKIRTGSW